MMLNTNTPSINFNFTVPIPSFRNRTSLKEFLVFLFKKEKKSLRSLNYIFCSDNYLLEINRQYLNHDFYTDIITFELSADKSSEGDIYISIDRVKDNAIRFNTSFNKELHRVIFHGALHLCGYKDKSKADEQKMREREDFYLQQYFN